MVAALQFAPPKIAPDAHGPAVLQSPGKVCPQFSGPSVFAMQQLSDTVCLGDLPANEGAIVDRMDCEVSA